MKTPALPLPLTNALVEHVARQFDMPDLVLPFWGYRKKTPLHRIVRLEGEGNYTLFHFSDGTQLMVSLTLKKMESRLPPKVFVRPHKRSIINLLYVADMLHDSTESDWDAPVYSATAPTRKATGRSRQPLRVRLVNGDRVDVSRRKASRFIKQVVGFRQEISTLR